MRDRFLAAIGVSAAMVLAGSMRSDAAGPRAQTATPKSGAASAKPWTPPRTADGQPDLQGTWQSRSATPLERPKALEGRDRLTDEEVAELKKRADRIFKTGNSDFAAGDNVFLAALANASEYKNPNATHGADEMVERDFDNRTSLVVDPPDGHVPPMTALARQKQAAVVALVQRPTGPEDFTNPLRCITWGVPRLAGRYGAGDLAYYQILQGPGWVAFHSETGHETRLIPTDGRPHLPATVRQWLGDSRGRWDGNTLVVETTNFAPGSNFMGATDRLRLVERFTRAAADRIEYTMTIDDPTTWSKPWTATIPLKQTREHLYEFACHEGNYEMIAGMLSAARADERAARTGQAR